jgi:acyl-CoA reductase-like NAD-dependent aldehyde dehydrogenase
MHCGQGCGVHTRAIVHNSIRKQFVASVRAMVGQLKIGDPADPAVHVGPLIREVARTRTERYVQLGQDSGARLVTGGKRPGALQRGFFYEPTVFDEVDGGSQIAQDEIFGPVGVVIGFDSDEEAVSLANHSRFGLHGGILSADRTKAYEMAQQIRAGQVWINGGMGNLYVKVPYGGYKRSGLGREMGPEWLREFMQQKAIVFPIG